MKQFDLKEYLANPSRRVVTRDGRNARIICTDRKNNPFSIIALCTDVKDTEAIIAVNSSGECFNEISDLDLFFAPEKHEGWVSICRRFRNNGYFTDGIFDSEEKAKERGGSIATVKVEWEE